MFLTGLETNGACQSGAGDLRSPRRVRLKGRRKLRALYIDALESRQLLSANPLDLTFGTDGKVLTDFSNGSNEEAHAIVVQPDSRFIVVGATGVNEPAEPDHGSGGGHGGGGGGGGGSEGGGGGGGAITPQSNFALARYNKDGSLDTSFGVDGKVVTDFNGSGDKAYAALLQPDGKIVVAGTTLVGADAQGAGGSLAFALARYNADGSLDTSFGVGGEVITDVNPSGDDQIFSVALSGGKIVAAGITTNAAGNVDFAVARYDTNGTLDDAFGVNGIATLDINSGSKDEAEAVAVQPDGKIVAAGFTEAAVEGESGGPNFVVVRYNVDGALDDSFGTGGIVTADFAGRADQGYALALQQDGKILVAGRASPTSGPPDFGLVRYNADGSLDTSFGTGGLVQTDFSGKGDFAYAMTLQPDGKIVAAGRSSTGAPFDFALVRYNPDGSPDASFGADGKFTTDFVGLSDQAYAIAMQGGKILVAGVTTTGGLGQGSDFSIARYRAFDNPGQSWIAQAYMDLLHRPVDPAGFSYWTDVLGQGVARAQVSLTIESTIEYRTKLVQSLYQSLLSRDADPQGLNYWINFLNSGGSYDDIRARFMASPEYHNHSGLSDEQWLEMVFQDALNRSVDPASQAYFLGLLQSGVPRYTVAIDVLKSVEADRLFTNNLYLEMLRRQADPAGQAYYVNQLQSGVGEDVIIAGLVGSEEYLAKA
jgi:uncharacterized delta-60 repeat protein